METQLLTSFALHPPLLLEQGETREAAGKCSLRESFFFFCYFLYLLVFFYWILKPYMCFCEEANFGGMLVL